MNLYSIALFAHILGALLVFVLLTVEGLGLRFGFASARLNRIIGPVSALLILVPGFYMMWSQWGFAGWIVVGITSYVLIAVLGAFTGISALRGRMSGPAATISWLLRVGMALGVVFDMTIKPDFLVATLAVLVGTVAGVVTGLMARRQVQAT